MKKIAIFSFLFLPFAAVFANECPFCDPMVLERQTITREEGAIGFLPHKPVVPGHVLAIPERHVERFEELTAEELLAIGSVIRRVHEASKQLYGNEDYILLQKNGETAWRSVPHIHFHYLPRSENQGTMGFFCRLLLMSYLPSVSDETMRVEAEKWRGFFTEREGTASQINAKRLSINSLCSLFGNK